MGAGYDSPFKELGCISEIKMKKKFFSFCISLDLHYLCRKFTIMAKKLLITLLFSVLSLSTLYAQVDPNENHWREPFDIYVGPKIGASYSQFSIVGGDPVIFGCVGGFVEVFFTDRLGMNVEMLYTHQGGSGIYHNLPQTKTLEDGTTMTEMVNSGPYDYNLDYINTIYKLKYYFTKEICVYTGFHLGTFINAKSVFENEKTNIRKYLHRQASIPIGISYETEKLVFEANYNWPIRMLANKGSKAEEILGKAKQHLFLLTVGYKIKVF